MLTTTPVQPPSSALLAALQQLQNNNFRQKDSGEFNPASLTPSAVSDPVGKIILSCPQGRLGVEGYRELQRLYPDGVVTGDSTPDFSNLPRTTTTVRENERQLVMIVCGGQTGVDQAALHAAERLHYERGGIMPKGRMTETEPLDRRFPMTENHSSAWNDRTEHNFTGADGTLAIFTGNELDGTALTIIGPLRVGRPLFVANLNEPVTDSLVQTFATWLKTNNIRCLNVGGPRQSHDLSRNIQSDAETFLENLLQKAEATLRTTTPSLGEVSFAPRA